MDNRRLLQVDRMCRIVPYAPAYRDAMIRVVQAVYEEYGFTWDADGYHRDLYNVESSYLQLGGMFWVLLAGVEVVGCVGVAVHGRDCELHRMYLLRAFRGRGLGRQLLQTALDFARTKGCRRMRAWSDVKLTDAHRLYAKCGFVQEGERICDDPDKSREYGFWKEPL